jgi:hypothetical protein
MPIIYENSIPMGAILMSLPRTNSLVDSASFEKNIVCENHALKPKFAITAEKKIERLWLDSNRLGWTYNDFVTHMLEVLIIVGQRGKVNVSDASVKSPPPPRQSSGASGES